MVPLMVQQDYKPQGWLGLILGSRMWYAMWDAEKDDDAAFERRLDSVVREIGERGKLLMVSEAVPPFHEPSPAPAPRATLGTQFYRAETVVARHPSQEFQGARSARGRGMARSHRRPARCALCAPVRAATAAAVQLASLPAALECIRTEL